MFPFQIPGFDEEELPAMMFNTPQAAPAPVAGAYTNPLRQAEEDQLSKVLASLKAEQLQGIQKGYQQPELSESQVFTTAVASLLPIVAGYMLNKEKGGAVGAQAGGLIGQGVFQGLEQERKLEAEKQKLLNEARKDELKDTRAELKDVRKAGMQAEDQFALEGVKQKGDIELQGIKDAAAMSRTRALVAGRDKGREDSEKKSDDRLAGQEARAVRAEYYSLPIVKSAAESAEAAAWIKTLLQGGTAVDAGQIAGQLTMLAGEVGVKTEGDIARNLPPNLRGQAAKLHNYMTGSVDETIPPDARRAIAALADKAAASAQRKLGQGREVIRKRVEATAPYSFSTRPDALGGLIDSLGTEYLQSPAPTAITGAAPAGVEPPPGRADYKTTEEHVKALKDYNAKLRAAYVR